MRRKSRIILILLGGFVLLLAVGALVVYQASQHVPEAYSEALLGDPVERRCVNDFVTVCAGMRPGLVVRNDEQEIGTRIVR